MAFGGPRSSCVRPGAPSARRQDSRKDLTPCRMALHFVSAGAHAPHSDETPGPTATRGRRTPLVAYAPSLSCAPPRYSMTLMLDLHLDHLASLRGHCSRDPGAATFVGAGPRQRDDHALVGVIDQGVSDTASARLST